MKFSSLGALFIASRIGPSEQQQQQAGLRRKVPEVTTPAPDCSVVGGGYQICKNDEWYYECIAGWGSVPLTRPVSVGTRCVSNVATERISMILKSLTDPSPSPPPTLPPSPTPPSAPLIQKPEVCYFPSGTAFTANANANYYYDGEQNSSASLEFGIMEVDDGDSLLVDVMVQSMILSVMGGRNDDDIYTNNYGEVVANAFLHKGCSALPCTNTTESVFPGGLVMAYAGSNGSVLQGGDDDFENRGNGLEFKSTNTGNFFFPGLEEGSYLLQVEFDLTAAIEVEEGGEFGQDVEINHHLVTVTRSANEGECDWTSTSKTSTKRPRNFKGLSGSRRHL